MGSERCIRDRSRKAPLGVFAKADIAKGTDVAVVAGEILDAEALASRYPREEGRYLIKQGTLAIDMIDPTQSGMCRFFNSCGPGEKPNTALIETEPGTLKFRTLRDVLPGEELHIDYGAEFPWELMVLSSLGNWASINVWVGMPSRVI